MRKRLVDEWLYRFLKLCLSSANFCESFVKKFLVDAFVRGLLAELIKQLSTVMTGNLLLIQSL